MFRLGIPRNNFTLDLPRDVKLVVRPLNMALMSAARHEATAAIGKLFEEIQTRRDVGASLADLPDLDDEAIRAGLAHALYARAVAVRAIISWTGVYNPDGEPLAVSAATIREAMDDPLVGEAFINRYSIAYEEMVAEGNASRPAPNGTSETGPGIAQSATPPAPPAPAGNGDQPALAAPI